MISKQNNVIEADVTRLVEKVQREKLLFYPLIIHLLWKIIKLSLKSEAKNLFPVYQVKRDDGQIMLAWQEVKESWPDFFSDYAAVCYKCLVSDAKFPKGLPPAESFGIFCFDDGQMPFLNIKYPLFWLYPFKYEGNKIILPIVAEGEIDAAFFKVCKRYLESGTDLS